MNNLLNVCRTSIGEIEGGKGRAQFPPVRAMIRSPRPAPKNHLANIAQNAVAATQTNNLLIRPPLGDVEKLNMLERFRGEVTRCKK